MRWAFLLLLVCFDPGETPTTGEEQLQAAIESFFDGVDRKTLYRTPVQIQRVYFYRHLLEFIPYKGLGISGQIDHDLFRSHLQGKIDGYSLYYRPLPDGVAALPPPDFVSVTVKIFGTEVTLDRVWKETRKRVQDANHLPDIVLRSLRGGLKKAHSRVALFAAMREGKGKDLAQALAGLKKHIDGLKHGTENPSRKKPDARALYSHQIRYQLHSEHTPKSLLELGMKSFRETEEKLEQMAKVLDPEKTWQELIESCKQEAWGADEIHERATMLGEQARKFVMEKDLVSIPGPARTFSTQPAKRGSITPFGHYRPGKGSKGAYVTPPLEGLSKKELLERRRGNHKYWTTIVSLHELLPGHHLQYNVAWTLQRNRIREAVGTSAYTEGWGLYCEEMMFRAGYYPDKSLQRLVALQMRLWRCARVIIDVGVQTGAMTEQEAVKLLVEKIRLEPSTARLEVGHYKGRPTYFSGYLLGYLEFMHLRGECERLQGERFDLKSFHDKILQLGPMPLRSLRRAVLHWAKS